MIWWLLSLAVIAALTSGAVATYLFYQLNTRTEAIDIATMGQAGDFFGGTTNPLLTFVTFIAVLFTVYQQQKTFDLSRSQAESTALSARKQDEAEIRRDFENNFYHMLNFQDSITRNMDIENSDGHVTGRDCFRQFAVELTRLLSVHKEQMSDLSEEERSIRAAYAQFMKNNRQDLGHYFRFLFNFIRSVDESQLLESESDTVHTKRKFVRLLRAQLSDYELLILFYNSQTADGEKFKEYIRRYDLLDNLPMELFIRHSHFEMAQKQKFITNAGVFD